MTPFKRRVHCQCCGSIVELSPDFLSTFPGKVLFVSVALWLGSSLSEFLSPLDFSEYGFLRVTIDLVVAAIYYAICRFSFSCFQQPKLIVPGNEEIGRGNQ